MGRLAITAILALLLAGCGGELTCWSTGFSGSGDDCSVAFECSDGASGQVQRAPDGVGECFGDCVACYSGGEQVSNHRVDSIYMYCSDDPRTPRWRDMLTATLCSDNRIDNNN